MAKSRIILDLANGTASTETSLKRVKVIFDQLGKVELNQWVSSELMGYSQNTTIPDYRIIEGLPIVSYTKGSFSQHIRAENVPLSLGKMPADIRKMIRDIELRDGVEALHILADSKQEVAKTIPPEAYPLIAKYNNDPFMMIYSAKVIVSKQQIQNVFSTIENRLLDALILLEKEFGILDSLDIETTIKTPEEMEQIGAKVKIIIFNDNSIRIGDNNKIKNTDIQTKSN